MITYSEIMFMLSYAGIIVSIVFFALFASYKRTRKYTWIFGCTAGFCFFTAFRHICFQIGYDDITDPVYEAYKDWTIYRFILSDTIRLFIWSGIGVLCYLAFIKQNKLIRCLFILGASIVLLLMTLLVVLSSVTSI